MTALPPIVALDTETTSLAPAVSRYGRRAWEFAAIRREPDGAQRVVVAHVQPAVDRMRHADPEALRIGGYSRAPWNPEGLWETTLRNQLRNRFGQDNVEYLVARRHDRDALYRVALALIGILTGATVVGSNPGFDTENVSALLDDAGIPVLQLQPWHYKLYDVAQHGSSILGLPGTGPSTADLSAMYRIQRPVEHTALEDAAWALELRDAIEGCKRQVIRVA